MSLTKIGSIGINTGIAFAGVTTIVTLNTANDALSIGATVNVGSGITFRCEWRYICNRCFYI